MHHAEYAMWKGRGSLKDLVTELERRKATTVDFVTDTRNLRVQVDEQRLDQVRDGPLVGHLADGPHRRQLEQTRGLLVVCFYSITYKINFAKFHL